MTITYDPACYALARHFLPSSASSRLIDALAQQIQERIEDWLAFEVADLAAKLGVPCPEQRP